MGIRKGPDNRHRRPRDSPLDHSLQEPPHAPLSLKQIDGPLDVEYRIAYIALCVDNNKDGIELLADLEDVVNIDKDYIQFGCAGWFWKRPVNSYVLQVQPERLKSKDKMIVDIQEAYHIEKVKTRFFGRLRKIVFGLIQ